MENLERRNRRREPRGNYCYAQPKPISARTSERREKKRLLVLFADTLKKKAGGRLEMEKMQGR